jgi:hypothetical protein
MREGSVLEDSYGAPEGCSLGVLVVAEARRVRPARELAVRGEPQRDDLLTG